MAHVFMVLMSKLSFYQVKEKKKFIIHVAFPEKGIYNLNIWLDFKYVLTYYIKNHVSIEESPYKFTDPIESLYDTSKLIFMKGKDIITSIDYENGQKKIIELINNLKNISKNTYDKIDANETKKKITEISNKLILISKEMYENFDSETTKDKFKEKTNNLIENIKELPNNFNPDDVKNKVIEMSESFIESSASTTLNLDELFEYAAEIDSKVMNDYGQG